MSMKPIKDIVAVTGKYLDRDGNEKSRYLNMGTVFKRDDGSLCMKIDCVPIGVPDWQGWVNLYDKKPRDQGRQDSGTGHPAESNGGGIDDEIPF